MPVAPVGDGACGLYKNGKLRLSGLGFVNALLQALGATMAAAVQFLFPFNFFVSHDFLLKKSVMARPSPCRAVFADFPEIAGYPLKNARVQR